MITTYLIPATKYGRARDVPIRALVLGDFLGEIARRSTRTPDAMVVSPRQEEERSDADEKPDPEVPLPEPVLEDEPHEEDRDEADERDQPL